jgi:hypothetical protein
MEGEGCNHLYTTANDEGKQNNININKCNNNKNKDSRSRNTITNTKRTMQSHRQLSSADEYRAILEATKVGETPQEVAVRSGEWPLICRVSIGIGEEQGNAHVEGEILSGAAAVTLARVVLLALHQHNMKGEGFKPSTLLRNAAIPAVY